jgi:hypothetical protein
VGRPLLQTMVGGWASRNERKHSGFKVLLCNAKKPIAPSKKRFSLEELCRHDSDNSGTEL